jgi:hypothetical protein
MFAGQPNSEPPAEKIVDVGEEEQASESYSSGFGLHDEKPGSALRELLQRNRAGFYGGVN